MTPSDSLTKRCPRCCVVKVESEFYPSKRRKAQGYCKLCARDDMRARTFQKLLTSIEAQRLLYADLPDRERRVPKRCPNPACPRKDDVQPPENFRTSVLSTDGLSVTCRFCTLGRNRSSLSVQDRKQYHGLWYAANRETLNLLTKEWRKKHPEQVKSLYVKRRFRQYGVTPEWYAETLSAQGGKCAICGSKVSKSSSGTFHVDHDHSCCKKSCCACDRCRRGLLCGPCNTRLGIMEKRDWVRRAMAYLRKYQQIPLFSK